MQCNASGGCVAGYQGVADPTGCNAAQMCVGNTRTAAQTCSGGQCVAATTTCANGCTGNDCTVARCGDGVVQPPEQCDDGNTVTETCTYGLMSCTVCSSTCQLVAGATSFCGDGVVQTAAGELCDDGNTSNLDNCSTSCKTCGLLVGPLLSTFNDQHGDSGLQFTATANATLFQFVFHNQGKGGNLVLRPVTADPVANRPILQMMSIPANLDSTGLPVAENVTVTVNWPLNSGTTYTLSDLFASNGVFASVTNRFPDSTAPGITIQGSWDAGDVDFNIPESTNDTFWYTFTGIRTCLR
jgi:cysteine-rich repeat protein